MLKCLLAHLAGDGGEQVLLVLEMPIQDRLRHFGCAGDERSGRAVVAIFGKDFGGDIENLLPSLRRLETSHAWSLWELTGESKLGRIADCGFWIADLGETE